MTAFFFVVLVLLLGFAAGWYAKGRYGVKVAADLNVVQDAARKV